MARAKGSPRPPGSGRAKGTPNKATAEFKARLDQILNQPEGWKAYAEQFRAGEMEPSLFVRLLEFRYGKPKTQVEVETTVPILVVNELER